MNFKKAMLLTIFVFPGAGHIVVKRTFTAAALIAPTLIALGIVIPIIFEQATEISNRILNGEVASDIGSIRQMVSSGLKGADTSLANIATSIILIAWLIGIVDLYRLSKQAKNNK